MFTADQYELLDFGAGRKLERFGRLVLDRPCPAAGNVARQHEPLWAEADAVFERLDADSGRWYTNSAFPESWTVSHGRVTFELRPTPFGHVGIFPEQAANWQWLADRLAQVGGPLKVLNLFAYTGGSTLAAAAAGAEVVHVDAAANVVAWARRNAEISGLADRPIRWIVEDALKFVAREVRRGNRYDTIILDPPSFGRGPKGQVWKATEHLYDLLAQCAALTAGHGALLLATCHTPEITRTSLAYQMIEAFVADPVDFSSGELQLRTAQGQTLASGIVCQGWKKGEISN
ncbi:MAG: class I SAM-dependent methyltransferase [Planctomycetales bacterium]|nr:class I SAM-dependent methyltransferase [Planctomycetales bacterium]